MGRAHVARFFFDNRLAPLKSNRQQGLAPSLVPIRAHAGGGDRTLFLDPARSSSSIRAPLPLRPRTTCHFWRGSRGSGDVWGQTARRNASNITALGHLRADRHRPGAGA